VVVAYGVPAVSAAEPRPFVWPELWAVWHDLAPGDPDIAAMVDRQDAVRRTVDPRQRREMRDEATQVFQRVLASGDRSTRFRTLTDTRLSYYDTERGGAYLEVFEGGRFFTVSPVELPALGPIRPRVAQPINIYFANEADLEFVPMDRTAWQRIASSLQTRPRVTVDLTVQAVGALSAAPTFSREEPSLLLQCHVTQLVVKTEGRRNPVVLYETDIEPVPHDRVGTLTSTGKRLSAPPINAEALAMTWQRTVGPDEPDYVVAARKTPRYREATEFQNADAWLPAIADELKARYERFEVGRPYHINFTSQMEPYDLASQGFELDFADKFFKYESRFPYQEPPENNEPARRRPAFVIPGSERAVGLRNHTYKLVFSNVEEISRINMPPVEGEALLERSRGDRKVELHVVFQVESVQPPDTGLSGGVTADRIVRGKVVEVRARSAGSGLPLFRRTYDAPASLPIALNVAPDVGLHPADADVRGLKAGGDPEELLAKLQEMFGTAFVNSRNESVIIFRDGKNINGTAFINSDYVVSSIMFRQKFDGDAIDAAADALIAKYGKPVFDSGRIAGRFDGHQRELRWTKPGVFENPNAGVKAEITRNQTIQNGRTRMEIRITLPGNREPYKKNDTTQPKISL